MRMNMASASKDAVRPITDPIPMYLRLLAGLSSAANDDLFNWIQMPCCNPYPSLQIHVLLIRVALSIQDRQALLLSHFAHALILQNTQTNKLFRVQLPPHVSHLPGEEQWRQFETLQEIQELFNNCLPPAQRLHLLFSPQNRQSCIEQLRQRLSISEYPVAHARHLLVERHYTQLSTLQLTQVLLKRVVFGAQSRQTWQRQQQDTQELSAHLLVIVELPSLLYPGRGSHLFVYGFNVLKSEVELQAVHRDPLSEQNQQSKGQDSQWKVVSLKYVLRGVGRLYRMESAWVEVLTVVWMACCAWLRREHLRDTGTLMIWVQFWLESDQSSMHLEVFVQLKEVHSSLQAVQRPTSALGQLHPGQLPDKFEIVLLKSPLTIKSVLLQAEQSFTLPTISPSPSSQEVPSMRRVLSPQMSLTGKRLLMGAKLAGEILPRDCPLKITLAWQVSGEIITSVTNFRATDSISRVQCRVRPPLHELF